MYETRQNDHPKQLSAIQQKTEELGFSMPSDLLVGRLLKSLVASKPGGRFLELGTGLGLSLAWIVAGMDESASVVSLDNEEELTSFAAKQFASDLRVEVLTTDGESWLENYDGPAFDLIFADTWPGKYNHLDEALALLKAGGIYLIDDMREQDKWPAGHAEKATALMQSLHERNDLVVTSLDWSSGVLIATKVAAG